MTNKRIINMHDMRVIGMHEECVIDIHDECVIDMDMKDFADSFNAGSRLVLNVEKDLKTDPKPEDAEQTSQKKGYDRTTIIALLILLLFRVQDIIHGFLMSGASSAIKSHFMISSQVNVIMKAMTVAFFVLMLIPFGALSDRYNRKYILCGGITFQVLALLASSFVPKQYFPIFMTIQIISSIADASYSSILSSIMPQLVKDKDRICFLSLDHVAIPIGSILGYVISDKILSQMDWRWHLRVSAALFFVHLLVVAIFFKVPPRKKRPQSSVSFWSSCKVLLKTRSLVFSTIGYSVTVFIFSGLSVRDINYLKHIKVWQEKIQVSQPSLSTADSRMISKVCSAAAFVVGALFTWRLAKYLKSFTIRAQSVVCTICLSISVIFLTGSLLYMDLTTIGGYIVLCLVQILLSIASIITCNLRMALTTPDMQAFSKAAQILVSNILGKVMSTVILSLVEDKITNLPNMSSTEQFNVSLKYDLVIFPCVAVIGTVMYIATSRVLEEDYKSVQNQRQTEQPGAGHSADVEANRKTPSCLVCLPEGVQQVR